MAELHGIGGGRFIARTPASCPIDGLSWVYDVWERIEGGVLESPYGTISTLGTEHWHGELSSKRGTGRTLEDRERETHDIIRAHFPGLPSARVWFGRLYAAA